MSKELGYFKKIRQAILEEFTLGGTYKFDELNAIEQALTPPTEQEVCEALSKYSELDATFAINSFWLWHSKGAHPVVSIVYNNSTQKEEMHFNYDLPLEVLEMIVKFYKGGDVNAKLV